MNHPSPAAAEFSLIGIDGSNPLGFLAALGVLRTLTRALPDQPVTMAWKLRSQAWHPVIAANLADADELTATLHAQLQKREGHTALELADNLNVTGQEFRTFAQSCVDAAHNAKTDSDRAAAEFAAAFACDTQVSDTGIVDNTALRTMSGAGNQHFLASMRHIAASTTVDHVRRTLFETWTYSDPAEKQTLRWDPADDIRYALQGRNPSGDPSRKKRGAMLGANRLAIEGLPVVTCAPVGRRLATTGFTGTGARNTFWTWPLWSPHLTLNVVSSLLRHRSLLTSEPDAHETLHALGVTALFRSQRITVGKFRNFTPATALL